MSFLKRNQRRIRKDASGMDGLMSDFLRRHGIQRQITSAMVVQKANEVLHGLLPVHARGDVKVISFSENQLKVAVRHAPAKHETSLQVTLLTEELIRSFPTVTISNVIHVINPKIFED